jgi:hypothetical protein
MEPKFCLAATRRNLFLRSKMKINTSETNSFSDPKRVVANSKASFKKWVDNIIHLNSHKIAADGRATEFFFSITKIFWKSRNQRLTLYGVLYQN